MTARRFSPAKINLFLHVDDKRADGYHNLCSLAVFADVGDVLSVAPSATLSLDCTGPFGKALSGQGDNLVLRAAHLLDGAKGARLTLEKNLPIASGIGGGSSDAAAALHLLNAHWKLGLSETQLEALGLKLGADVPVCLRARPSMMQGRGEILTDAPALPPFAMVLVNPGVAVATPDVFKRLSRRSGDAVPPPFRGGDAATFAVWLSALRNDLATPAAAIAPVINEVKSALAHTADCLHARMSGSGATCFGLYATYAHAEAAARDIAAKHPNWWVKAARPFSQ